MNAFFIALAINFYWKLHENEEILAQMRPSGGPPLDPPLKGKYSPLLYEDIPYPYGYKPLHHDGIVRSPGKP